ncbi:MAG: GyrI-like domain-containing protein [Rickettsiaceae bacterium]|nr:GyrI-like domain-containing protein [Rickettsiaceae bacterium]
MQKTLVNLEEKIIVGLNTNTGYEELSNGSTKIADLINNYYGSNIEKDIANRKTPGITYSVYSDYTSNYLGNYQYHYGEEVSNSSKVSTNLHKVIIPTGKYIKFTTEPGKIPNVIIQAWQEIWQLEETNNLGGIRLYNSDFELYDQRSMDPNNAVVDIYIGIKE